MIPAVRHQRILRSLRHDGGQTVGDLATTLNVSSSTIRRDLSRMEYDGILQRTFGGAILTDEADEPIEQAHQANTDGKMDIALAASALITDGMTIILDVGSTTLALAEALRGRQLTIITASLPAFWLFTHEPQTRILLLGGSYRPDYQCTTGHMTVAALRDVHADIAFLGCTGVASDGTIRDNTADQVPIKRAIMAAADAAVLVCDSSKFPGQGTYTVGDVSALSHVVTNAPIPASLSKKLAGSGTEVLYS
ncbi:DeoR/GlpR family DNA-binding transcription regulator [Tessaracoccus sp.]